MSDGLTFYGWEDPEAILTSLASLRLQTRTLRSGIPTASLRTSPPVPRSSGLTALPATARTVLAALAARVFNTGKWCKVIAIGPCLEQSLSVFPEPLCQAAVCHG